MARIAAVVVALAAIVGAFWWRKTPKEPGAASLEDVRVVGAPPDPVRLAPESDRLRLGTTTAPAPRAESVPCDLPVGAEDLRLGEPVAQPETVSAAPPDPPRAEVDPEAAPAADDPSDFQLPAR